MTNGLQYFRWGGRILVLKNWLPAVSYCAESKTFLSYNFLAKMKIYPFLQYFFNFHFFYYFLWHCPLKDCAKVLRNGCWFWLTLRNIILRGDWLSAVSSCGWDWLSAVSYCGEIFTKIPITRRNLNQNQKYFQSIGQWTRQVYMKKKNGGRTSRWTVPLRVIGHSCVTKDV